MKIQIDREKEISEINNVTVLIHDVEFRISVNQFNELIINKAQYGAGEGSIIIKPSTSNQIYII
jgi:hypothetical protein